ncbi:MAG: thioredoxin-disulfide reductase [Planctomycetota bacterium]|nr:thioredoxin-disulfide reductase [Planctomycetota bacterium]
MSETIENVVIVGSGPSGWTAGLYSGRANLSPLLFAGQPHWPELLPGGQLMTTTEVENYPGFENGILGPDLMEIMRKQAERYGCRVIGEDIVEVDFNQRPAVLKDGAGNEHRAWTVIIATGARPKRLGIPGETEFFGGKGVSSCAVCDGAFYKEKVCCITGGGDTAMEEALYLTHHASKVYVIHRREELRASKIMQQRAFENSKIEFVWNSIPIEVVGENSVNGVRVRHVQTNEEKVIPISGFFLAIGHIPNTGFVHDKVALHGSGYIRVDEHQHCLNPKNPTEVIEGVYAAGDCHDHSWRQAVTAAGFGCMAALSAERYLAVIDDQVKRASINPNAAKA